MDERTPPFDSELEKGVLGAALVNQAAALEVVSHLSEDDFYLLNSKRVYAELAKAVGNGEEADTVTIKRRIPDDALFILDCMTDPSMSFKVAGQISELKNMGNRRKVIDACVRVEAKAYGEFSGDIVSDAISSLMDIDSSTGHKERSIADLCDERLEDAMNPEDYFTVEGFDGLHLFGGDFVVIGGRPGSGKSAYAAQLGMKWAEEVPVMFYSYEMTEGQIADRVIAYHSDYTITQIEDGLSEDDLVAISDSMGMNVATSKFSVRRAAGMTNDELVADMYRFKARGGKVVIIDYLQLAADKSKNGLTQDTTLFSNRLRRVALDSDLLVVAIAQLNRAAAETGQSYGKEKRGLRMPQLSDLRESGAIEQDATAVCLIAGVPNPKYSAMGREFIDSATTSFMDFKYAYLDGHTNDPEDDPTFTVINWAKVRQGKTRKWAFIFDGAHMRFAPIKRLQSVRPTGRQV